jgi:hypothetical protein
LRRGRSEMSNKPAGRAITWPDGSVMIKTIVWGDEFYDSDATVTGMRYRAFELVHDVKFNGNDALHRKAWEQFRKDERYKLVEFNFVAEEIV